MPGDTRRSALSRCCFFCPAEEVLICPALAELALPAARGVLLATLSLSLLLPPLTTHAMRLAPPLRPQRHPLWLLRGQRQRLAWLLRDRDGDLGRDHDGDLGPSNGHRTTAALSSGCVPSAVRQRPYDSGSGTLFVVQWPWSSDLVGQFFLGLNLNRSNFFRPPEFVAQKGPTHYRFRVLLTISIEF